jgi:hypothetical protein
VAFGIRTHERVQLYCFSQPGSFLYFFILFSPIDCSWTDAFLIQFRNHLVNTTSWATSNAQVLAATPTGIAVMKGNVISIMSNIGSPPQNLSTPVNTPWPMELPTIECVFVIIIILYSFFSLSFQ